MKKLRCVFLLALTFIVIVITGCASFHTSSLRTSSDYKNVWNACLDSLADVRFSATSADSAAGLIVADHAVVSDDGKVSRLNIRISKERGSTVVIVKYEPASKVSGYGIADDYVTALKKRIPDLEPIVINTSETADSSQKGIKETNGAPKNVTSKSTQVAAKATQSGKYLIVTRKTGIRATNNTRSKVIASVRIGDKVEIIDSSDNWYKVTNAKGKSGWILKNAVKPGGIQIIINLLMTG